MYRGTSWTCEAEKRWHPRLAPRIIVPADMSEDAKQWATLTVQLASGPIERDALAQAADQLDEVGALLAMDPEIDGVQTLDPKYEPIDRPALRIYTRPEALLRVESDAKGLMAMHGLAADFTSELRNDTQWKDLWKRFYRPLVFGDGLFLIRPSWIARREQDPELELLLDPGRAFGTGLHPTTQLCVEQLCQLRRAGSAAQALLDLGCGSGILGLSGLRLFPEVTLAVALDVDPEATATASENAEINGLADRIEIRTGDLDALQPHETFDIIVANIRPSVLIPIASDLIRRLRPGGHLALSGILPEEADAVAQAYLDLGWKSCNPTRELEGWSGLDFTRP